MLKVVSDVLLRFNLREANCRGQCYDEAANVAGLMNLPCPTFVGFLGVLMKDHKVTYLPLQKNITSISICSLLMLHKPLMTTGLHQTP